MIHYEEYQKTGDTNYFEEIIDAMVLDGISGMNDSFKNAISNLSREKKRMTILSLLDKDLNLFKRIKALTDNSINKMDHIKDVILMLREYVKVGEVEKKKFGEVMTPLDLVKEMLDTLPEEVWSNPNLKWLDPANGTGPYPIMVIYKLMNGLKDWEPNEELRYKHIVENMIYVCELQPKNMFLYMCAVDPFDTYKLNIYTGSFLDTEFDKHMKEVWNIDNFDISIGNPPFNQNIDMKFVKKCHELSEKILIIHPATWLIDEKGKQNKFNEVRNLVKENLESIKLFNGNPIFKIELSVPCVVTYLNKSKSIDFIKCYDVVRNLEIHYKSIDQINKFSNLELYPQLKDKILINSKKSNIWKYYKTQNKNEFVVSFTGIIGHTETKDTSKLLKKDFYTIVSKSTKVCKIPIKESFLNFYFETEIQAQNFLNYLKTDFCRFCLSIYKSNKNIHRGELEIVPWLDFTQEWTDEKLYKEFNLTEEEIEFIEKHIPKYY
jgi:site-specific DNA-methyltransferase (adenine-specific)